MEAEAAKQPPVPFGERESADGLESSSLPAKLVAGSMA